MPQHSEYVVTFAVYLVCLAMPGLPLVWLWSLWTIVRRKDWQARHTFAVICLIIAPVIEVWLLWPFFDTGASEPPDEFHEEAAPSAMSKE